MVFTAPAPPPITYEQASKVIAKLADLGGRIVLVGGQAVNFWANYYLDRSDILRASNPLTSKDIDFYGRIEAVRACADRLGGTAILASMDDAGTPNSGIVTFVDEDRHERVIDFLWTVAGIKNVDGLPAKIKDAGGNPIATFYVIDPVSCLISRAYNVVHLPQYKTEHARNQLRAAIICAREYGRDLLARGQLDEAMAVNDAVIDLAQWGDGVDVFAHYKIDVLEALILDAGFPAKFYTHHVPFARKAVERARRKGIARKERTEAWERRKKQNSDRG